METKTYNEELSTKKRLDTIKENAENGKQNHGLEQTDNRNSVGTVDYACGVSSSGVTTSYGIVTSYDTVKQETQSSLAIG